MTTAHHKTIFSLLCAKAALLVFFLSVHQGWIYLGDVPLFGEQAPAPSPDPSAEKAKEDGEEKKEDSPRKSFFSSLLNLAPLETKNAKKEDIGKFLGFAERKQRQIEDRLNLLKKREEQLVAIEKSIDAKLSKIDEERKYMVETIQKEREIKGKRLDKLLEFYEKMEPKKAAPIFEKLDKDLITALFKRLKQKQITNILENMTPARSVEISEYFGRVRSLREYDLLKEMNVSLKREFQDCKGLPKTFVEPPEEEEASVPDSKLKNEKPKEEALKNEEPKKPTVAASSGSQASGTSDNSSNK